MSRSISLRRTVTTLALGVLCTVHVLANQSLDDLKVPDVENGKALYNTTCVACHGDDGKGQIPGVPDLRGDESPLAEKDTGTLLHNILTGYQSPGSIMAMPPKGGNTELSRQDVLDILQYMRKAFGGSE